MSSTSVRVWRGRVIELSVDSVVLPNGTACELEMVHHPGGAAVVALDAHRQVCLLRQYRHAARDWLWELPAGKVDGGEAHRCTAERELREEAGLLAADWHFLGSIISSPGVFTEWVHLYLARELVATPSAPEPAEVIEVVWMPLRQALGMAADGTLCDAKSIAGLFRAQALLEGATA